MTTTPVLDPVHGFRRIGTFFSGEAEAMATYVRPMDANQAGAVCERILDDGQRVELVVYLVPPVNEAEEIARLQPTEGGNERLGGDIDDLLRWAAAQIDEHVRTTAEADQS